MNRAYAAGRSNFYGDIRSGWADLLAPPMRADVELGAETAGPRFGEALS